MKSITDVINESSENLDNVADSITQSMCKLYSWDSLDDKQKKLIIKRFDGTGDVMEQIRFLNIPDDKMEYSVNLCKKVHELLSKLD